MPQNDYIEAQASRILTNTANLVTHLRNNDTPDPETVNSLIEGTHDALTKISAEVTPEVEHVVVDVPKGTEPELPKSLPQQAPSQAPTLADPKLALDMVIVGLILTIGLYALYTYMTK